MEAMPTTRGHNAGKITKNWASRETLRGEARLPQTNGH
jgi:hypothetical protein